MFHQLLLAIDDTQAGSVAVSFAIAKARQQSASVHVVHVNQYQVGGRGFTVLTEREATALVDSAVEELRLSGVPATGSVVRGTCFDIAARIVESAQAWSASAIILGSGHHRRLRRGRDILEQVARLSSIAVLSAPAPLKVPRSAALGVEAPLARGYDEGRPIAEPRLESSGPGESVNRSHSEPPPQSPSSSWSRNSARRAR